MYNIYIIVFFLFFVWQANACTLLCRCQGSLNGNFQTKLVIIIIRKNMRGKFSNRADDHHC